MTRLPGLIATDLDGTLAMPDGSISPRTAKAFAAATAAGSVVALVTGRPVRWMPRVYAYLAAPYPALCVNGAVVYDGATDEIRSEIDVPAAAEMPGAMERVRAAVPDASFATEIDGGRRMLHDETYPLRDLQDPAVRLATRAEMVATPAVKLLVRAIGWDPDELTLAVRDAVGPGRFEITHSSAHGLVEMSAPGVHKGSGLATFAHGLGFGPADTLVFGDMPNDLPMFAWAAAGGQAVAVANAHPEVLAAATAVTASLADDGVAVYLESLLAG